MSAAAEKKTVYRVGDVVKIVEPKVFVRVGYPLTKEHAVEVTAKEYDEKIYAFMREASETPDDFTVHEADPRLYHDLVNALASYWLRLKRYGGKERQIYTETNESLRNTGGWRIFNKRVVKTGTYDPGGLVNTWGYEPDYEPPHLANEKSHVLLGLERGGGGFDFESVEIEAANVILDTN